MRRNISTVLRTTARRTLCSEADEPRARMEYDVVIVGGGPSGLAAAIKLKQLDENLTVCLIEKGAEIGQHILSGAVMDPRSLTELLPDWKNLGAPVIQPALKDHTYFLTERKKFWLPCIPSMQNHGNYIISLGALCAWLSSHAEGLGVDIFPGFAASEAVLGPDGHTVLGVATSDVGISKTGQRKQNFERGTELIGRQTILAEGCRGSISKQLISKFNLRANSQPPTYALGLKEIWEVLPENHEPGRITHTVGWPLDFATYGGSFCYHLPDNMVSLGFVAALDYINPTFSPYLEFQRMKHHPYFADLLKGGKCHFYGARSLTEGGLVSLPKLTFPGGVLVGDTAGTLNLPKIKGIHTAMKSGMIAAESVYESLKANESVPNPNTDEDESGQEPLLHAPESYGIECTNYSDNFKKSWVYKELHAVRNYRQPFNHGLVAGVLYAGLSEYVLKGKEPWSFKHPHQDHESLTNIAKVKAIQYPKPDGVLSFDRLTNLARSGTNHNHDQPSHLVLADKSIPKNVNIAKYGGPEQHYCPAGVYEFVEDDATGIKDKLVINAQNCLHCKACDIKDPTQNINWTVPEGGGGPKYSATM